MSMKMLKDCSVQFNEQENWVKAVKDGKKEIKFDLQKYFDDQQLKSTLNSSRKLKSISLSLGSDDNETILTNYINYLRAIGENVTELTISSNYYTKSSKIKRVIESFSNLEIINFNQMSLESGKKQIFKVNNEKIKKVILNFHVDRTGETSDIEDSHDSFCNNFRFANNTLEYFKINVTGDWYINDLTFEKASTRKFLKNQNKLTEN
ncbi:hypothetical protein PVAND_016753 [Polypedilum vanderplanki]|uniref:Uncharacterized protein n=1 Tax=Polypedilum vanderplanki TaxID=319348 RepID=A0A9J6BH92_POLVA|nr:hypothetical protein PVAND_016753 [Polypedilum vanderplanki]